MGKQVDLNNISRVTVQTLAAVLGGTQSLHTNGYDEALSLPTEEAARIALRTQQVIAFESGVPDTADPLAGSYFVESLTHEVEEAAWKLIGKIEAMGGSVSAIEQGFIQNEIAKSAYEYQRNIESGEKIIVGVNKFTIDKEEPIPGLCMKAKHHGFWICCSEIFHNFCPHLSCSPEFGYFFKQIIMCIKKEGEAFAKNINVHPDFNSSFYIRFAIA